MTAPLFVDETNVLLHITPWDSNLKLHKTQKAPSSYQFATKICTYRTRSDGKVFRNWIKEPGLYTPWRVYAAQTRSKALQRQYSDYNHTTKLTGSQDVIDKLKTKQQMQHVCCHTQPVINDY
jgi:hypothetical protein